MASKRRMGHASAARRFRGARSPIRVGESGGPEEPNLTGRLRDALQRHDREMLATGVMLDFELDDGSLQAVRRVNKHTTDVVATRGPKDSFRARRDL